jgi:hypothetical protein
MAQPLVEQKTQEGHPLFGLGHQARSPFISTVDRVNAVVEMSENGRQQQALIGLPGLVVQRNFGDFPARAVFVREGTLTFFVVSVNQVFRIDPGLPTVATVATLSTDSGPVWIDDSGTELFINDGVSPVIYKHATGVSSFVTNVNYPTGARGCVFLQTRFWVYVTSGADQGKVFASGQFDGNSWDPLNFITPSARPGGVVAIYRWSDDLVIFGKKSVEWWSGTPSPIPGALGFQPSAPANTEIGGSAELGIAKVGGRLFFVGHDDGSAKVYEISSYSIAPVSIPAVEIDLSRLNTASAICCGYSLSGHSMFQCTIQGQTFDRSITWAFDGSSQQWTKRESANLPYYRGLLSASTLSNVYITDAFTGKLYRMDENTYSEDGEVMPFEVTSTHILNDGDSVTIHGVQVDVETGVGMASPPGDDPHGVLSVSKDGGKTWPIVRFPTLGKTGQYRRRARESRFGMARDFAIRFRITEPVPRKVTGAYLNMTQNYT